MEKRETQVTYQVEITQSANLYFYDLVEYLYTHYSIDRAEEIVTELEEMALSLNVLFDRGSNEPKLATRPKDYKYLLYKRSKRKSVKIIYYVDKIAKKVYVTDFFPTEMNDTQISERNK